MTINQVCASAFAQWRLVCNLSGMETLNLSLLADKKVCLNRSMQLTSRAGQKMGDLGMVDTMIKDGLWVRFTAITWALLLKMLLKSGKSRVRNKTRLRLLLINKAEAAQKAGKF